MKGDKNFSKMTNIKYLGMFLGAFVFVFFSYFCINKGLNNKEYVSVAYESNNDINYKVYLKKNNFFSEPYLDMDRTYIASLIDYIDVMYNYNLKYSDLVSGTYKYYIKGTILANKNGSNNDTNYWSKSYDLSIPEVIEFNEQDNFNITTNVKIDYQKYSDLLKQFRKEYGLSISGLLKVELIVESVTQSGNMNKPIEVNSNVELSVPLTEQAIELSIESENNNDVGEVVETINLSKVRYGLFLGFGIFFGICSLLCAGYIIYNAIMTYRSRSDYNKKLKKILSTYDSIIVNVKKLPNFDHLQIIDVHSFQELIDAHSEVRMPINYVEMIPGVKSVFALVSNNMVWRYTLKHENYKK